MLENARGEFVSGACISRELGVSRQAISKAVRGLSAEGYEISVAPKKGYRLAEKCDLISPGVIAAKTGARILFFKSCPSTNNIAAAEYLRAGECLVVALSQSAGRSKDGSGFPSPENGGIYVSAAFPVSIALAQFDAFRTECALAVERVIFAASGKRARRVRLDEFYFDEKKAAGILVEFMVSAAANRTEFAVVGVGIYTGEAFSKGVAPVPSTDSRNRMIISLCEEMERVKKLFQN